MTDIEPALLEVSNQKPQLPEWATWLLYGGIIMLICLSLLFGTIWYLNTPNPIATPILITVAEGESVRDITKKIKNSGVVKSDTLLYLQLVTVFDPKEIKAATYSIREPLSSYEVAKLLITGDFDTNLVSITVFEGESREKIADRLAEEFSWFDSETFLTNSRSLEGKLFPDTYFVPTSFTTEAFVTLLNDTHQEVLDEYAEQISISPFTTEEVVTLASIVEREANTIHSMRTVAGIFRNRLAIGMPLQADASIEYVLEHELHELTSYELAESLREIDSPYNTYLYAGLPPTPIGNPGRMAIEAVLDPIESDYLYYLTGNDGLFYYAESYQQHLVHIDRYLK